MPILKYSLLLVFFGLSTSCSIDPLMLAGAPISPDEYDFGNPEVMDEVDSMITIDESLIHIFPLISDNNGDKATIWAVYFGDTNLIATDTVLFFCHGNSRDMNGYAKRFRTYANIGHQHRFGLFAMDYRGFGASEGKTTSENWVADMNACLSWLESKGASGDRTISFGNSLGGVPSVLACTRSSSIVPTKLIHDAPFAGAGAPLQASSGLSLTASFAVDIGTIDPIEEIKNYTGMYMWNHCTDDQTVDISFGQALYDNHSGSYKEANNPTGCDHYPIDGFGETEQEAIIAYQEALLQFITR